MEEIVTRKEILDVMIDVEETMTAKAGIGIVLSVIILILPFERSVIAVKQTGLEMEEGNSNEGEITNKRDKIGLVLSVTTLTSPSERSVTAVKRTDLEMEEGNSKAILDEGAITSKRQKIGLVQSAITLTSPSEINAIAVKQIDLEMEGRSSKGNLNEVVITSKRAKIGLVLSATTLTSPSEINAIAVKLIDLVPVAVPHREVKVANTVALGLKEAHPDEVEDEHLVAQVNHEDLDLEAQVEAPLGVIDQEEAAVGAEFGSPQHSFCLIPSKPYGEQGGYALGRCSRA